MTTPRPHEDPDVTAAGSPRGRTGRSLVLVVDDDAATRGVVADLIRRAGLPVEEVDGGAAAVAACRARPGEVAAVLVDVWMPEVDGLRALAAIRRLGTPVRCFLMTGDPGFYTREDLERSGAERVFEKPLDLPALLRALAGVADGHALAAGPAGPDPSPRPGGGP